MQNREREGRRFSGAGLGNAEKIFVGKQRWDRLLLNGRGRGVALFVDGFEQAFVEIQFGEENRGSRICCKEVRKFCKCG